MPRIHYDGGGRYRTSGHLFEEGDIAEVDEELADYLCEKDAFARVNESSLKEATVESDDTVDTLAEAETSDDSGSDAFDVDEWIDDHHYQAREEQVRDGAVDEHLDAIAEAESSTTVQDAVGERRAELEG
ncbi:hypothetical protein HALG_00003 [Halorubrum virus CGphi46]|uniref:Uncharacterized protein n=1 Tax=Halorubrum virus CGphi46 TaxID=754066 RepID=R9TMI5_9CAUD|nr:hypothetical protein HALG_00003 [Halorubrum virus CGphi46]AGN33791.1 hypothetical protein HALG_00003 [Halorubrum virus CGphi46]